MSISEEIFANLNEDVWALKDLTDYSNSLRMYFAQRRFSSREVVDFFTENIIPLYLDARWRRLQHSVRYSWVGAHSALLSQLTDPSSYKHYGNEYRELLESIRLLHASRVFDLSRRYSGLSHAAKLAGVESHAARVKISLTGSTLRSRQRAIEDAGSTHRDASVEFTLRLVERSTGSKVDLKLSEPSPEGLCSVDFDWGEISTLQGCVDFYLIAAGEAYRVAVDEDSEFAHLSSGDRHLYTTVKGNLSLRAAPGNPDNTNTGR